MSHRSSVAISDLFPEHEPSTSDLGAYPNSGHQGRNSLNVRNESSLATIASTSNDKKSLPTKNRSSSILAKGERRVLLQIVGAYFLAIIVATLHLVYFKNLNGRRVPKDGILRQSYVTAISWLIVISFRTAITAALGLSFTQYLWLLLRTQVLRVDLIEDLFRVRSNLLSLFHPRIVRHAPGIFLAASVSWLVPLATIYTAGALTVQNVPHWDLETRAASILNPAPGEAVYGLPKGDLSYFEERSEFGSAPWSMFYVTYSESLAGLAKFVMATGQIIPMKPAKGENFSYETTFQAPILKCETVTLENITSNTFHDLYHETTMEAFEIFWPCDDGNDDSMGDYTLWINRTTPLGASETYEAVRENNTCACQLIKANLVSEFRALQCSPYIATYAVSVAYNRGTQEVKYTTSGVHAMEFDPVNDFRPSFNITEAGGHEWMNSTEFHEWKRKRIHLYNIFAILDALAQSMKSKDLRVVELLDTYPHGCCQSPNGIDVIFGDVMDSRNSSTGSMALLEATSFNSQRFNYSDVEFNPLLHLNITEASLNSILANISISALSLNLWQGPVTVNSTEYANEYSFSNPLNFYLPYGLCLVISSLFIVNGINALLLNGVAASDGGFLQLLMTTTGDTQLSRLAATRTLGGAHNAPEELLKMSVRFGELVGESETDGVPRAGFGTVEETSVLRKRMVSNKETVQVALP